MGRERGPPSTFSKDTPLCTLMRLRGGKCQPFPQDSPQGRGCSHDTGPFPAWRPWMRPEEDTKQGGSYSWGTGEPHQRGLFRSGDSEMLCWEEGRSERFVALPPLPKSLGPLCTSPTHEHPASQMVTLTHSCCKFPWLRPCCTHPGLDSGSRHVHLPRLKQSLRTTHRGRQSWHPRPTPPDSLSCLLPH